MVKVSILIVTIWAALVIITIALCYSTENGQKSPRPSWPEPITICGTVREIADTARSIGFEVTNYPYLPLKMEGFDEKGRYYQLYEEEYQADGGKRLVFTVKAFPDDMHLMFGVPSTGDSLVVTRALYSR